PVDTDAPLAGCLIKDAAQGPVDLLAGRQCLLQIHGAGHVTQGRDGQLLDTLDVVGDLVRRRLGVGDLEVNDCIDRDNQVVLGDDRLWREGHDLFPQVDQRLEAIDERNQQAQPGVQGALVAPEPFDDPGVRLRHNPDRSYQRHQHEERYDADQDIRDHLRLLVRSPITVRGRSTSDDERCRTVDLYYVHALARFNHRLAVVGPGRPHLAGELDASTMCVDLFEDQG